MNAKSSTSAVTGQVSTSAAEVYEKFFVPALFAPWAAPMLDAVDAREGDRLVDVGTGTGVVARMALRRVGPTGSVIAVDPNEGMLAVAKAISPSLTVRRGTAEHLPVDDGEIDCVTCQFALMFFVDREHAVDEMRRALKPGGRLAVGTWAAVDQSPGYAAMVELLADEIGDWAAEALRAPFCIGAIDQLCDVLRRAFDDATVIRRDGQARFASLDEWMYTEIRGWTVADRIDDEQFERLREAAATRLARFVNVDGSVSFAAPALIGTATAQ